MRRITPGLLAALLGLSRGASANNDPRRARERARGEGQAADGDGHGDEPLHSGYSSSQRQRISGRTKTLDIPARP
jgi:hypothetical protein